MPAQDIMATCVITVGPDAEVAAIAKCLLENRISAVPVVEAALGAQLCSLKEQILQLLLGDPVATGECTHG
jgi:CBS domain-containing protein